jgi:hypothetical protein
MFSPLLSALVNIYFDHVGTAKPHGNLGSSSRRVKLGGKIVAQRTNQEAQESPAGGTTNMIR